MAWPYGFGYYHLFDDDQPSEGAQIIFIVVSDTGSGAESTPEILAIIVGSDAGSGVEATPEILAALALADTGAAVETTPEILALLAGADSGTAVETTPEILAALGESDAGSGSETSPEVEGDLSLADTGTAVEMAEVETEIASSDAVVGVESLSILRIPAPRRRGGSSSGGGGGVGWLPVRVEKMVWDSEKGRYVPENGGGIATAVAEKLKTGGGNLGAHPEKVKRRTRDNEVERLRARIRKYKAEIQKMQSARAGKRAELEAENVKLAAAIERMEARLEAAIKAAESAAKVNLELLVESTLKGLTPATAPAAPALPVKPGIPPVIKLALSAGVFLAVHYGVPKEQETLRAMGYGMAIAIAASAIGG